MLSGVQLQALGGREDGAAHCALEPHPIMGERPMRRINSYVPSLSLILLVCKEMFRAQAPSFLPSPGYVSFAAG